jgi:hypothetical protein
MPEGFQDWSDTPPYLIQRLPNQSLERNIGVDDPLNTVEVFRNQNGDRDAIEQALEFIRLD